MSIINIKLEEILRKTEDAAKLVEVKYECPEVPGTLTYEIPIEESEKKETPNIPEQVLEEDTSGKPMTQVDLFLDKYADGNDIIQCLRLHLMQVLSDVQWIKESSNQNEQWALDFADALNELSISL